MNKQKSPYLLLIFFFFLFLSLDTVYAHTGDDSVVKFPASLEYIGESAFEGTSARKIVLNEGVKKISEYSFARVDSLETVIIPNAVFTFEEHTFDDSPNVVICGINGSYAYYWAKRFHIPFKSVDFWVNVGKTFNHLINVRILGSWSYKYDYTAILLLYVSIFFLRICVVNHAEMYPIDCRFP